MSSIGSLVLEMAIGRPLVILLFSLINRRQGKPLKIFRVDHLKLYPEFYKMIKKYSKVT